MAEEKPEKKTQKTTTRRRTTKRTVASAEKQQKTTKKAAPKKATAKKTAPAKKAASRSRAKSTTTKSATAPKKVEQLTDNSDIKAQIGDKIRVHQLAKLIGIATKEVVAILATQDLKKVAQSSLTHDQALAVIEQWEQSSTGASPELAEQAQVEDEEALRRRVEKNVENEIHQIEVKIDRELEEDAAQTVLDVDTEDAEQVRHRVEKNVDNEVQQITEKVDRDIAERLEKEAGEDLAEAISEEEGASLLEDVEPEVTPAPEQTNFEPPLFKPAANKKNPVSSVANIDEEIIDAEIVEDEEEAEAAEREAQRQSRKRRRGRRGTSRGRGNYDNDSYERNDDLEDVSLDGDDDDEEAVEAEIVAPVAIKGSTRLEAQRRRREEMREESRNKRHVVSEAEFLARRESVNRTMVVRERERSDHPGLVTQVGILEDDMLVEHFVTSETQSSMVGNIYLGRVQNVLPSMEAAFIDIGKGRNGVLYSADLTWRDFGLNGKNRRIEQALKAGDQVLVQVSKDPVGHKGARLTTQISLPGRYLVYVPGGKTAGISRKLPAPERKRLKRILRHVVPKDGGVIIRTAAEGVSEEAIAADVRRLHNQWIHIRDEAMSEKSSKGAKPVTLYEEPNMLVKVVRDLFNEDFNKLVVDGKRAWNTVSAYINSMAPDLSDRLVKFNRAKHGGQDAFEANRINEQLQKALSRKVWLPSGGNLVIDRTEAMTVIDVNTGKFTGSGGNLEETITRNNLEAAEEIVRQMRLRDLGGMIVVDFVDMVLPENQDLVLRRLKEALGRDHTRHQVSEVTSLGLVQMTRKRLGTGLLETFSTECEHCEGRGIILHEDPVEHHEEVDFYASSKYSRHKKNHNHGQEQRQLESSDAFVDSLSTDGRGRKNDQPADHKRKEKKRSIEELATAVVVTADEAPEETTHEERHTRKNAKGRRRQQRRAMRETSYAATAEDTAPAVETEEAGVVDDLLSIVDAAIAHADSIDPVEPNGAHYLPIEEPAQYEEEPVRRRESKKDESKKDKAKRSRKQQGIANAEREYEEAKREFEASPRRKRKVRGNSRSDVAPQPSDFGLTGEQEGGIITAAALRSVPQSSSDGEAAQDKKPSESSERKSSRSSRGRGRRRVVRTNTAKAQDTTEPQAAAVEEATSGKSSTAQNSKDSGAERSPRRGRRRVVRKLSSQDEQQSTSRQAAQEKAAQAPGSRRRGRRRVVRSSNK